jgi:PAS domain S-box-containing protein
MHEWEPPSEEAPRPTATLAPARPPDAARTAPDIAVLLVAPDGGEALHALVSLLDVPLVRLRHAEQVDERTVGRRAVGCTVVDGRWLPDAGLAEVRRLREARRPTAASPVLLLVTREQEAQPQLLEALALGMVDCIRAPLHPPLVRAKVALLLELALREGRAQAALARAERVQADAVEGERLLRVLLANMPGMAYRCENAEPWPFTFVSAGVEALCGWPAEDFLEGRVKWGDLILEEERERLGAEVDRANAARAPYSFTFRFRDRAGQVRWAFERGVGVPGPDGRVETLEGFITDVTPLHRAQQESEEARRQAETERAGLQALLQQLPVPVHIAQAPTGRTLHVNAEAERVLGLRAAQLQTAADFERLGFTLPDGRPLRPEESPFRHVLATGEEVRDLEARLVRPDGTPLDLLVNAGPVRDEQGRARAVVVSFSDITEHRRTAREQALLAAVGEAVSGAQAPEQALEALARLTVPELGDGCVLAVYQPGEEPRRFAVHADPSRASLLLRLPRPRRLERLDGESAGEAERRHRRPLLVSRLTEALLADDFPDAEARALLQELAPTSWLSVPLVARGRALGSLTLMRCGARPPLDARALRLAEELGRRAALAADGMRLYREAREAVRLRDEFLQVASHELKTPMTPLQLKLAALSRDIERLAPEGARERLLSHVTVAHRQVRKLSGLVGVLLDVGRLAESGRLPLHLEEGVDLAAVLRDVCTWFEPEATRLGSALHVEAPEGVPGRWDRLRLEQVVTNLLSNALRYGRGRPVRARAWADGAGAHLEVGDEGIGIAPDALGRIFGKFERASSERHYGGLGLGLYITRSLVEAMGGRVEVQSTPGEGSCFRVSLPRSSPGPGAV